MQSRRLSTSFSDKKSKDTNFEIGHDDEAFDTLSAEDVNETIPGIYIHKNIFLSYAS